MPIISNLIDNGSGSFTVNGSGFGGGPNVVHFDNFSADADASITTSTPLIGQYIATSVTNGQEKGPIGESFSGSSNRALNALLSSSAYFNASIHAAVPDGGSPTGYELFQEIYASFAVKDLGGFPGLGGTATTFSTNSSVKDCWLMLGPRGDRTTATGYEGNDVYIPGWTGGNFLIAGNNSGWGHYHNQMRDNWAFQDWNQICMHAKADSPDPYGTNGRLFTGIINANIVNFKYRTTDIFDTPTQEPYWDRFKIGAWYHGGDGGKHRLIDEVYIATGTNAAARICIGDAATLSACTRLHHAIPSAWSANAITFDVSALALPAGDWYVYIFDATNDVNTNGFALADGGNPEPPPSDGGGAVETPDVHWPLNETSGTTAANTGDIANPTNYDGTLTLYNGGGSGGAFSWLGAGRSWGTGGITGGIQFTPTATHFYTIEIPNALPLTGLTQLSMAFWVRIEALIETDPRFFAQSRDWLAGNIEFQVGPTNSDDFRVRSNGNTYTTAGAHYPLNTDVHTVVVVDFTLQSDQIKVYFNGSQTPALTYTTAQTQIESEGVVSTVIGGGPTLVTTERAKAFNGELADMRFWFSKALTPLEVERIYLNSSPTAAQGLAVSNFGLGSQAYGSAGPGGSATLAFELGSLAVVYVAHEGRAVSNLGLGSTAVGNSGEPGGSAVSPLALGGVAEGLRQPKASATMPLVLDGQAESSRGSSGYAVLAMGLLGTANPPGGTPDASAGMLRKSNARAYKLSARRASISR